MKKIIFIFCIIFATIILLYKPKKIIFKGKIEDNYFKDITKENFNFLWSKGLKNKDDYALKETTEESSKEYIINQIKNKEIIWIRSCDLDTFSELTDHLKNDIILVSGDGDLSIPSELKKESANKILECNKIKKWLTQNYDGTLVHPKLKTYPIGFDLHTSRTYFDILSIFSTSNIYKKINTLIALRQENKINKVFCDLHLSQNTKFNNERSRVKLILNKEKHINFLPYRITQKEIWKKYASHKFVVSTFGNGLDCHRTWEALFLGAIVITKTSSLDSLYQDLPVAIVNDWDDITENNLVLWSDKYTPLTKPEYINTFYKYDYWLNK